MVQKQVYVVIVVGNVEAVLIADKGKIAAHFQQERSDIFYDACFKLRFAVFNAHFDEVKIIIVLYGEFGLKSVFFGYGFVKIGLVGQVLFKRSIFDIVDQNVFGPAVAFGHFDIKLALKRVFAFLQYDYVFSPAYLSQ